MTKQLSVVVPVYNNAPTLCELHRRLTQILGSITEQYEILFVDDCGQDHSSHVIQQLAVADTRVAALRLAQNVGQNRAVLIGLTYAQGDVIIVMDADLQDPPEAIPSLLPALTNDVAAVFAGRRGQYEVRGRLLSSWLFKHTLYVLSAGRVPVDAGLFVAMRQHMRTRLLAFNVPQPYVVGLMGLTGLKLRSVPVVRHANYERQSGYTTRKRIALARNAVRQMLMVKLAIFLSQPGPLAMPIREYIGARFQSPVHERLVV